MVLFLLHLLIGWTSAQWATDDTALRWGPYRPQKYFGIRPQAPRTLSFGLMWADGNDQGALLKTLRDTCEMDEIDGYGWHMYDTRTGGTQTLHDKTLHIDLNTSFVKQPDGESWGARIAGAPKLDVNQPVKTSIIFQISMEDIGSSKTKSLECGGDGDTDSNRIGLCTGKDDILGNFRLELLQVDGTRVANNRAVKSIHIPDDRLWQSAEIFKEQFAGHAEVLLPDEPGEGNMQLIQMVFEGSFTFDIFYSSERAGNPLNTPKSITTSLDTLYTSFPTRVDKAFPRAKKFRHSQHAYFAQSILSQLMGGLGFFHGDAREDRSNASEYQELDPNFWEKAADARGRAPITTTQPTMLLSHTPSRPVYPRGFLWDEGFHLLPIIEWDFDLAVSVIKSWMNLMDAEGWIGREQILGAEARSKVPGDFQVQYPQYANPPTLLLLLPVLVSKLTKASAYNGNPSQYLSSREKGRNFLKEMYPLLARHAAWFRRTQAGNFSSHYPRPENIIPDEGYRWRGTSPGSCLTSGLDDFPRANPPHRGELHVDALAWVAASALALQEVARYLGRTSDAAMYKDHVSAASHNLDVLHWSPELRAYCDATISTENSYQHVCHLGYIALMPFSLGLLGPSHPNLPALLDLISDPNELLSPYGLRSLSAQDELYYSGAAYWRGPVWINLNVLAVLRLWELGRQEGPQMERARSLAIDLRDRIVNAVFKDWSQAGYIWELYSDKDGKGSHSHPFTGWSACVILLMGLGNMAIADARIQDNKTSAFLTTPLIVLSLVASALFIVSRKRNFSDWTWLEKGRWWRGGHRYEEVINLDDLQRHRA